MMSFQIIQRLNYYRFLDLLEAHKYIEALAVVRLALEVAEEEYDDTERLAYNWRNSAFDLLAVQFPKLSSEYEVKDRYTDFERQLSAYIEELDLVIRILGRNDNIPEDILSDEEIDYIWELYEKLSKLEKYLEEVGCMAEEAYKAYLEYYRPTADLEGFQY